MAEMEVKDHEDESSKQERKLSKSTRKKKATSLWYLIITFLFVTCNIHLGSDLFPLHGPIPTFIYIFV